MAPDIGDSSSALVKWQSHGEEKRGKHGRRNDWGLSDLGDGLPV